MLHMIRTSCRWDQLAVDGAVSSLRCGILGFPLSVASDATMTLHAEPFHDPCMTITFGMMMSQELSSRKRQRWTSSLPAFHANHSLQRD